MFITRPFFFFTASQNIGPWNTAVGTPGIGGCRTHSNGVVLLHASSLAARGLIAGWQDALRETAFPTRPALVSWLAPSVPTLQAILTDASGGVAGQASHGDRILDLTSGAPPLPPTVSGSEAWLRWLAARASTWYERQDGAWASNSIPTDDRIIERRLDRWATFVATIGRHEDFLRFLCWEGLGDADARRAVSSVRLTDKADLPRWCQTLSESLTCIGSDGVLNCLDPEHPLPFEDLLLPFVQVFWQRVQTIPEVDRTLAPQAQQDLSRGLLELLARIVSDEFYVEFCSYRLSDLTPLAPFVYQEPDAVYRRFVVKMRSGGLVLFYQRFPVLARILATLTDLAVEATSEFVGRLATDLPQICATWNCPEPVSVVAVHPALGDRHRGGQRVMGITFANGLQLIYKPKDLGIDVVYNALLAWLNDHGAPVDLRPLRVLDCGTHGWIEYVSADGCVNRAAVERYYRRAGALLCLVYLLQGVDCHAENLIAAGEQPVLVDCETLLSPQPWRGAAQDDRWRVRADRLIDDSVLSSSLLPRLSTSADEGEIYPPCGLCDASEKRPEHRVRWKWINTDRMMAVSEIERPQPGHNVPRLADMPARLSDYTEQLVAGFAATYRFLMTQRAALLAGDAPLAAFRSRYVRFLLRSTRIYSAILQEAMRPSCLRDGVDHSLNFELLARPLSTSSQRPVHWPALQTERQALMRHDVPFFGARTDWTSLLLEDGRSIEAYFARPSFEAMLDKLQNLSEEDLAFQTGLIRGAIMQNS
jgi:lantibiotic modifying enzyme